MAATRGTVPPPMRVGSTVPKLRGIEEANSRLAIARAAEVRKAQLVAESQRRDKEETLARQRGRREAKLKAHTMWLAEANRKLAAAGKARTQAREAKTRKQRQEAQAKEREQGWQVVERGRGRRRR